MFLKLSWYTSEQNVSHTGLEILNRRGFRHDPQQPWLNCLCGFTKFMDLGKKIPNSLSADRHVGWGSLSNDNVANRSKGLAVAFGLVCRWTTGAHSGMFSFVRRVWGEFVEAKPGERPTLYCSHTTLEAKSSQECESSWSATSCLFAGSCCSWEFLRIFSLLLSVDDACSL